MDWKIDSKEGCYVALGADNQRYEIGEGPNGTWKLIVYGYRTLTCETLSDAFSLAEKYERDV